MSEPEPPEFDPRAPLMRGYAPKLDQPKKSVRQWLSEPGAWLVVAALSGFAAFSWGICFVVALFLANGLRFGELSVGPLRFDFDSALGIAVLATVLFGAIVAGWAVLAGSNRMMGSENGIVDRLLTSMVRRSAVPLELDEAPALLARKRGNGAEAARLYTQWIQEFPHRTELRFHLSEVQHHDLGDKEAALRGYRDFLRRLKVLDRDPTRREQEFVPLAEAYIVDLERGDQTPPPRRTIKV
ncbi:MAG: hypothetical protein KDA24_25815 [Deltaproteobacteria bacterium]|nr:hypothetical protein [Deltaproteobacteria bacterium]